MCSQIAKFVTADTSLSKNQPESGGAVFALDPSPRRACTCAIHLSRPSSLLSWLALNLTHQFLGSTHDLVLHLLSRRAPFLHKLRLRPGSNSCGLCDTTASGARLGGVGRSGCALPWCDGVFDLLHDTRLTVASAGAC